MSYRLVALEDFAHDRDVIAQAIIGPAPRLSVPSFDDLRPGDAETGNEAVPAGQRINRGRAHRRVRRGARSKLHHARAEPDALGNRGDISERADRVGTVALRSPDRVVSQLFRPDDALDGKTEVRAGIANRKSEFHKIISFAEGA